MLNRRAIGLLLLVAAPLAGCSWFEDPTPENIRVRITGPAGAQATVAYSTQFVAAVDEQGVTRVEVFWADTVAHTLPVDTTIYIGIDRRFFAEVTPTSVAEFDISVVVDVDDRNQIDESGTVRRSEPFRFAYLFNQRLTRFIQVVI